MTVAMGGFIKLALFCRLIARQTAMLHAQVVGTGQAHPRQEMLATGAAIRVTTDGRLMICS